MAEANRPLATFHDGAVVPDDWFPVVVGTPISDRVVCLRFGTGGGNVVVGMVRDDGTVSRTLYNVGDRETIVGRFYVVASVTGTVANISAGVIY